MSPIDPRTELEAALFALADLAGPGQPGSSNDAARHRLAASIGELRRRLDADRIRVLVVGESKRGKSTFTNALIGRPVLPMGVTPLTAVATTVTYGPVEQVRATLADGSTAIRPLTALPELVTEDGNPGNRLGVSDVVVELPAPLLTEGVELVDTPGTGSVHHANTVEAEAAYESMDAAIFVLSTDPPISASEQALLHRILPSSVTTFVVLNKADRLDSAELAASLAFTRRVVVEAAGRDLPIYVCSARQALDRADDAPGIDGFLTAFTRYLTTERSGALLTSLRRYAAGAAGQLLDEVLLALRADEVRREQGARNVELFREHLDTAQRREHEATDLARGESRRLLDELNDDAERMQAAAARRAREVVDAYLASASEVTGAELETEGHRLASEAVAAEVDAWRSARADSVRERFAELDSRLRAGLDRDMNDLRPAARELLGVELVARPTGVALAPSRNFYYRFTVDADPAGELAAGIRHHLPGRYRRTRAIKYLLPLVDRQARQQVGRARADLQERLTASTNAILATLAENYADHHARLAGALDTADRMAASTDAERSAERAALAGRRAALQQVLARLDAAAERPQEMPTT